MWGAALQLASSLTATVFLFFSLASLDETSLQVRIEPIDHHSLGSLEDRVEELAVEERLCEGDARDSAERALVGTLRGRLERPDHRDVRACDVEEVLSES